MQPGLILRKTALGLEEVQRNALGLGHGVRRVLIQVDGHRTVAQLLHDNAGAIDVTAALEQLLRQGLVDATGAGPAMAAVEAAPGTGPSTREALIQMAETLLGPMPAAQVVQKLRGIADAPPALEAAIEPCARLIKLFIDERKAVDFRQQAAIILGRAATSPS